MTQEQIMENLHNAWSALVHRYDDAPDEATRQALNLLRDMIHTLQEKINLAEQEEQQKQKAIELEEWIAWFHAHS